MVLNVNAAESVLWSEYREHRDIARRNRLVELHLKLAFWAAGRLHRRYPKLDLDDLTEEASLAIIAAVEAFDPARGAFATYAYHKIRGRFTDLMRLQLNYYRNRPTVTVQRLDCVKEPETTNADVENVDDRDECEWIFRRVQRDLDRSILDGLREGETQKEIAKRCSRHPTLIVARLRRLRSEVFN